MERGLAADLVWTMAVEMELGLAPDLDPVRVSQMGQVTVREKEPTLGSVMAQELEAYLVPALEEPRAIP